MRAYNNNNKNNNNNNNNNNKFMEQVNQRAKAKLIGLRKMATTARNFTKIRRRKNKIII